MPQFWRNFCHSARSFFQAGYARGTIPLATAAAIKVGRTGGLAYGFSWPFAWYFFQGSPERPPNPVPVYAWGDNSHGLVAPDYCQVDVIKYPTQMVDFTGLQLMDVSAAKDHAAAIDGEGNLYQWGQAVGGSKEAKPVMTLVGQSLSQVICVNDAVLAFSQSRQRLFIIAVPRGKQQMISETQRPTILGHRMTSVTFQSALRQGERALKVVAGHDHFIILGDEGSVLSGPLTGRANVFGQLGRGPTESTRWTENWLTHRKAPTYEKFMSVFLGYGNRSDENIEEKIQGVEGLEEMDGLLDEFPVDRVPLDGNAVDVACGDHHTLVLGRDGKVQGFGSNQFQQLALGSSSLASNGFHVIIANPQEIPTLRGVTNIAAGGNTSYFVLNHPEQTEIYAAGAGLYGQLGNGTWNHAQSKPVLLQTLSHLTYYDEETDQVRPIRCRWLKAGPTHAAAVMSTYSRASSDPQFRHNHSRGPGHMEVPHGDDLYLWGNNKSYQLGLGGKHHNQSRPTTPVPFAIRSGTSATDALQLAAITDSIAATEGATTNSSSSSSSSSKDSESNDLIERRLRLEGPLLMNREESMAFTGGQLQLLTRKGEEEKGPLHRVYCGPNLTIIY